jgi:peptidoglycan/LPS O-acetylase OafA/YrhL
VFFGPDTRFDGLLLGGTVAAARHGGLIEHATRLRGGTTTSVLALAGFALASGFFRGSSIVGYAEGFPAAEVIAAVLIVAAVEMGATVLAWKPLVWVGSISYGLYVWQATIVLLFGRGPIQILIAVAAGWASTRWIERPFRHRRSRKSEPRHDRTAAELEPDPTAPS